MTHLDQSAADYIGLGRKLVTPSLLQDGLGMTYEQARQCLKTLGYAPVRVGRRNLWHCPSWGLTSDQLHTLPAWSSVKVRKIALFIGDDKRLLKATSLGRYFGMSALEVYDCLCELKYTGTHFGNEFLCYKPSWNLTYEQLERCARI